MACSNFREPEMSSEDGVEGKGVSEGSGVTACIMIGDNGEIICDESALKTIIGKTISRPVKVSAEQPFFSSESDDQPASSVTFVQVEGNKADSSVLDEGPATMEPVSEDTPMMLDQEQISQLENVLRSEEGKSLLGEILPEAEEEPIDVGDIVPIGTVEKKTPARRKSQRQIDKEMKEEAERIRKENQAKEAKAKIGADDDDEAAPVAAKPAPSSTAAATAATAGR